MSWQILYGDQDKVREARKRGAYDDASLTSWGRLDDLMALAEGLGILHELNGIHPELTREGSIPRWFIQRALWLRTVVGDERLSALPEGLLRDAGVLRLLGCTAREIRAGLAPERNRGEHTPCHGDSLCDSLKQTPTAQFDEAYTRCRARWIKAGCITRQGTYSLDATKIEVDGAYEGAGEMTVVEETVDAQGKLHRRTVVTKGFKLVTLSSLLPNSTLLVVMAYGLLPIQQPAITVSEERIAEGLTAMGGAGAIRVLLLDRRFRDGERLGRWQTRGIAVRVPVTHNMAVLADRPGLARLPADEPCVWAERTGVQDAQGNPWEDRRVIGFSGLETLASSPGALNGLLVTAFRGRELSPEQPWGAMTTLPVRPPTEVLAAFDAYDDRSLVENVEYRELKQGYRLPTVIGKDASAIAGHIFCELLRYSAVALDQQRRAERYVGEGMRRRRRVWKERLQVVVYVGCWYGLFELRACVTLLGRPPTGRLDETRVRLRPRRRP